MNRPENVEFILKDIKSNILDNYVCFLEKRINKAIEYIKEDLYEVGGNVHGSDLPFSALEPLLEILGDKENE